MSFCSPFSHAEFLAAASNLSSSTASGSDVVDYSMLKHLPRSGMDCLFHIFNLSWALHSFPFIWKTSSIIPIHKMEKPLGSLTSFRLISLTSCISKLFERIILSHLLVFLESNSILSSRQAGFHPGRSTLDQILYISQSNLDGFNKPRPDSRTILATIDFFKAFDSVWHPALFHKLCWSPQPLVHALWSCPGSGAPWSSAMLPSLGRGRVTTTTTSKTLLSSLKFLQTTPNASCSFFLAKAHL